MKWLRGRLRRERVTGAEQIEALAMRLESLARRAGDPQLVADADNLRRLAIRLQAEDGTPEEINAEAQRIAARAGRIVREGHA